jgi:hypothetical protein
MAFGASVGTALLALIFNATAWANYADNAASAPQTNVDVALSTADPTAAGTMATDEIAYTSYARASVARTSGGWTVAAEVVSPVATIVFPDGTGGSGTVTNFSVGKTGGGASAILITAVVSPTIVTGAGITPELSVATTLTLT